MVGHTLPCPLNLAHPAPMETASSLEYIIMRNLIRPNTFVQIMCIQPPLLSVGVLQPGHGLLVTLMVRELGSAPFHLAPKALGSVGSKLQRMMLSPRESSIILPGVFWALSRSPTSKETFSYMSPLQAVPEVYSTKYTSFQAPAEDVAAGNTRHPLAITSSFLQHNSRTTPRLRAQQTS